MSIQESQDLSSSHLSPSEKRCIKHGHHIVPNSTVEEPEGTQHEEANCMACNERVTRSSDSYAYCYCKNCSLILHMECAQSFNSDVQIRRSPFPLCKSYPGFRFPKRYACNPCKKMGKAYSEQCGYCLFASYLKCRHMPTAITRVLDKEHFLTILLKPKELLDREVHRCNACGKIGTYNMYLSRDCGTVYHYDCIRLPPHVAHQHGGYNHNLSLRFHSDEAEDYLCDVCLEAQDPSSWFYYCEYCIYSVHLHCVDTHEQDGVKFQDNIFEDKLFNTHRV